MLTCHRRARSVHTGRAGLCFFLEASVTDLTRPLARDCRRRRERKIKKKRREYILFSSLCGRRTGSKIKRDRVNRRPQSLNQLAVLFSSMELRIEFAFQVGSGDSHEGQLPTLPANCVPSLLFIFSLSLSLLFSCNNQVTQGHISLFLSHLDATTHSLQRLFCLRKAESTKRPH